MRHAKRVKKLKRTASHRKAMLKNMATSLFEHKRLTTTVAKAKALRPYAEQLITKAKHALQNEQAGRLPEGQTIDIHNRRIVARHIQNKAVLQELFDTIAPMVEDRPGGYCRIIKTGFRRRDAAQTAIIELVDWAAPQDGAVSKKSKKKSASKPKKSKKVKAAAEKKAEEIEETVAAETAVEQEVTDEVAEKQQETAESKNDVTEEQKTEEQPAAEDKSEKESGDNKEDEAKEEKADDKTSTKPRPKYPVDSFMGVSLAVIKVLIVGIYVINPMTRAYIIPYILSLIFLKTVRNMLAKSSIKAEL